jgi:hypothetical protein
MKAASPFRTVPPFRAFAVLWFVLLPGCGGGGGSGMTAPSNLSYPTAPAFTVGVNIASLTPSVTGTVNAYSVTPNLPTGLTLSTSSGAISGIPTAATASATYTVTASNEGGSTIATLTLVVNAATPAIAYPSSAYSYTVGIQPSVVKPTNTGGAGTWSVPPALPAGLSLNTADGAISGTPTQPSASATYTIKASNSTGSDSATLSIAVAASPLLDLGHVTQISSISFTGNYLLSDDDFGHWALWQFSSGDEIASGTAPCIAVLGTCTTAPAALLAGSTILTNTEVGLAFYSGTSGALIGQVSTSSFWWMALASDGSYACVGSPTALTCWNPSGQQLFTEAGNYERAQVFAAPSQLQVALGARGAAVIETIATASGTSSVGTAFNGTFSSWFTDGASFISTASSTNTVYIYSASTVLLDQRSLPALTNLTGQGNWFWTFADVNTNSTQQPLNIYKVGSSATPTASYSFYEDSPTRASGLTLAVFDTTTPGSVSIIDLSGSTPNKSAYTLTVEDFSAFAAISATQWLVGNDYGVLVDGSGLPNSSRFLDYGEAWSLVGGGPRVVVSTASGRIISYNTTTNSVETTINLPDAQLALSSDGSVLAAAAEHYVYGDERTSDRSIYVYSMPAATQVASFPFSYTYGVSAPVLNEMSLSADGSTVGEVFTQGNTTTAQALKVQNGASVFSTTSGTWGGPLQLSPDGTLIAFSDATPATSIYQNGTLTTSLSGLAVGWLDDSRVLVDSVTDSGLGVPTYTDYKGASLYSPTGTLLSSPTLPAVYTLQALGGDLIYAPGPNEVLSVSSAQAVWASADPASGLGALTNSDVVFVSGTLLLAQPYPAL